MDLRPPHSTVSYVTDHHSPYESLSRTEYLPGKELIRFYGKHLCKWGRIKFSVNFTWVHIYCIKVSETTLVTHLIWMLQQSHACNMQHVEDTINYPQLMDYFRSAMIKATKQWKLKLQPKDVVVTGQIKKRKSFLCSLLSSGTI